MVYSKSQPSFGVMEAASDSESNSNSSYDEEESTILQKLAVIKPQ